MSMGSGGDELRLKLHIDTSAVADDLVAVDKFIDKYQRTMQAAFNRTPAVRRGRVERALNYTDVLEGREHWTPEIKRLERMLATRSRHIERAAAAGELEPPPTIKGRHRLEAQQRLDALRKQTGPQEITAKQKFFDDMVTSLRRGAPNVVGMAAGQTGIPGASRLAHTLMGLAGDNPLVAGGLGAAVAVGAGALAVSAERARFQRQQASLASALVGGPAFGDTRTLMGLGVMQAAQQMSTSKEEGGQVAYQLASAGMRPGQATQNMQNVLGMTKGYGLQTSDIEPLVAALGTAAGMSSQQIGQTLRDLVDVSGKATGSVQQLTQGLGALSAVNATAGRDAFGLAAVQRAVGPTSGINAGQLMAPAMGAFGTQALGLAGLLGISPERLVQLQKSRGGTAQMFGLESGFMQTMSRDVTGQEVGLGILSDMGGLDISKLKSDQKLQLAQIMQTGGPGQAWAYYQAAIAKPKPKGPSAAELARAQTSPWDNFWLAFGNMFTQGANQPLPGVTSAGSAPVPSAAIPGVPLVVPLPGSSGGAGGGKFGLHMVPAGLASQVAAAATGAGGGRSGDATHTVKIEVTVKDQRGNTLGHKVDTTRVIAGARTTHRPPYDRPKLDTAAGDRWRAEPWNEGW